MALSDLIIGAELGGRNIGNPRSSAFGPSQFISSTWLDMLRRNRPDLASLPRDQQLALRSDPALSRQMTEAYAAQNADYLRARGHNVTPGNTYLAHFAGPAGAAKVLGADPRTKVADILSPDAMKANPFLANMTAGDLRGWAARKMGAPIPPAAIPQAPLVPSGAMAQAGPQMALAPTQAPTQAPLPNAGLALHGPASQAQIDDALARYRAAQGQPIGGATQGGLLGALQPQAAAPPPMPQTASAAPSMAPLPQTAPNLPLFAGQQAPQQGPTTPMPEEVWKRAYELSRQPSGLAGWLDPRYQNTFGG